MRILGMLIGVYIILVVTPAIGADTGWGIWTDSERKYTYAFLKNNEFRYWGLGGTFSQETKRYEYSLKKTEGVWQQGENICWRGEQKANLMIYVDTLQCCMMAQFIGNKLLLSEVWSKGSDSLNICNNRVLTRIKEMPKD